MQKEKSKKRRKRKRSPFKLIISLSVIGLSAYLLYAASQEFVIMFSLKNEISANNTKINSLKSKESTLSTQKEKLKDPQYVLRYARDKYLVSKSGEQVFKLPGGNTNQNDN